MGRKKVERRGNGTAKHDAKKRSMTPAERDHRAHVRVQRRRDKTLAKLRASNGDFPVFDPPQTPDELHEWIERVIGVRVQRQPMDAENAAPFDYVVHTFFEGTRRARPAGASGFRMPNGHRPGCVVWACRGGGKTYLAALATLLDMIFKPGIQTRLLGGSVEQGQRMLAHLRRLTEIEAITRLGLDIKVTARGMTMCNGAVTEVLAASETSVRGERAHKIRCDEVDLFDPKVWDAVQCSTRSHPYPGPWGPTLRGGIEALSTMQNPFGIMWTLAVDLKREYTNGCLMPERANGKEWPLDIFQGKVAEDLRERKQPVFRWGLMDVLEKCPEERSCDGCALWQECQGRAKGASGGVVELTVSGERRDKKEGSEERAVEGDGARGGSGAEPWAGRPCHVGHFYIDDAIEMKQRVAAETWDAEMLCRRPLKADAVYSRFDAAMHVVGEEHLASSGPFVRFIAGMDFGFRSEAVLLLAGVNAMGEATVLRENARTGTALGGHIDALKGWIDEGICGPVVDAKVEWIGIDPSGRNTSDQTGKSNMDVLKEAGFSVKYRILGVEPGVRKVRARLNPAWRADHPGRPRLFVHRVCTRLIECLGRYHYPRDQKDSMEPVKDGNDHACDALRYMMVCLDAGESGFGKY